MNTYKKITEAIKNNKAIVILSALAIILFFFVFPFFRNNLSLELIAPEGSVVFIDNVKYDTVREGKEKIAVKVKKSGEHSILVSKSDSWPWMDTVNFQGEKESSAIRPIIISKDPQAKIIEKNSEEYAKIKKSFLSKTGTKINPAIDSTGKILMWKDNNSISIKRAEETENVAIFLSDYPINSLSFYPNRNDYIIVAAGDTIFALEINTKNPRNFIPIFQGAQPSFTIQDETDRMFIQDGSEILELTI